MLPRGDSEDFSPKSMSLCSANHDRRDPREDLPCSGDIVNLLRPFNRRQSFARSSAAVAFAFLAAGTLMRNLAVCDSATRILLARTRVPHYARIRRLSAADIYFPPLCGPLLAAYQRNIPGELGAASTHSAYKVLSRG